MSQVLNNEVDILNVANIDNDIRDSYTRAMIAGEEKETYCTRQGGYDINEFFIWTDRQIYKTKATISQGDTFVLNTNIELAGTLSDQMYQLFSQSPESMRAVLSNIENGSTASRNFVKGEYILWTDGFLYEVTANTNIGTAWAVGTNITKKNNITDEITLINSDLSNEIITRSKISAHNFLLTDIGLIKRKNTEGNWVGNAYTFRGITYTVNDDLTVTVSGTNSSGSESYVYLTAASSEALRVPVDNYILSGCPSGGSDLSYRLQATLFDASGAYITGSDVFDFGEGVSLNIQNKEYAIRTHIAVRTGVSISSPITFKPMLRVSTDPSNIYSEPTKTNRQLSDIGKAYAVSRSNVSLTSNTLTPLTDLVLTLPPGKYLISTATNKYSNSVMSESDTKGYIDSTQAVLNADVVTVLSEYGTSAPWYFNYGKYYGKLAYIEGTKTMTVYPQLYNYSGGTVLVITRVIAIKLS